MLANQGEQWPPPLRRHHELGGSGAERGEPIVILGLSDEVPHGPLAALR